MTQFAEVHDQLDQLTEHKKLEILSLIELLADYESDALEDEPILSVM